mmetsp:Transcript_15760/g.47821  ORF Transcript_15760/g.47821 Transcript_15760/m.47821 type:complete len:269 (+) Transcript_15760:1271-2077(+)
MEIDEASVTADSPPSPGSWPSEVDIVEVRTAEGLARVADVECKLATASPTCIGATSSPSSSSSSGLMPASSASSASSVPLESGSASASAMSASSTEPTLADSTIDPSSLSSSAPSQSPEAIPSSQCPSPASPRHAAGSASSSADESCIGLSASSTSVLAALPGDEPKERPSDGPTASSPSSIDSRFELSAAIGEHLSTATSDWYPVAPSNGGVAQLHLLCVACPSPDVASFISEGGKGPGLSSSNGTPRWWLAWSTKESTPTVLESQT